MKFNIEPYEYGWTLTRTIANKKSTAKKPTREVITYYCTLDQACRAALDYRLKAVDRRELEQIVEAIEDAKKELRREIKKVHKLANKIKESKR